MLASDMFFATAQGNLLKMKFRSNIIKHAQTWELFNRNNEDDCIHNWLKCLADFIENDQDD